MNPDELANRFRYHPANTQAKADGHADVRELCRSVAVWFNAKLPEGREKALAITNLEQAMFWANAALARTTD